MITRYQTARLIHTIQADDNRADPLAEKRVNAKELDLFENALSVLTTESFIEATVRHFYTDDTKKEEDRLIRRLTAMMD